MSSPFFNRNKAAALVALALVVALMAGTVLAAPFAEQVGRSGPPARAGGRSTCPCTYLLSHRRDRARIITDRGTLTREFASQAPEAAARAFMGAYGNLMR